MASGREPRSLEEALAQIRELREEVDRLTDFVDNGAVGLHWVDREGTIVWTNRTELRLLGYTYDEYVGRHIREFHVIDDEQDARELLNEFLASCGADVRVAASALEADDVLRTWAPTVMLVDLALAGEDGVSFYERVRAGKAPGVGAIPAVALTAHATPADLERTRRAGFALHLRKPAELDVIAKVVASISEQSAREQAVS
jgi:CheY-like chemotaxis protein